jgi:putative hemolysin
LLVVANHPLALVDGFAIASIMKTHRRDVKVLGISSLRAVPQMRNQLIRVKLGDSKKARSRNRQATSESIKWLRAGHALIIFPSGDISRRKYLWKKTAVESEWAKGLGLLIRRSKADVLPVYFHGQTSLLFQFARSIHKIFGQLLFFRELLLSRNMTIRFVLGDIVNNEALKMKGNFQDVVDYLRIATYSLANTSFEANTENEIRRGGDAGR